MGSAKIEELARHDNITVDHFLKAYALNCRLNAEAEKINTVEEINKFNKVAGIDDSEKNINNSSRFEIKENKASSNDGLASKEMSAISK